MRSLGSATMPVSLAEVPAELAPVGAPLAARALAPQEPLRASVVHATIASGSSSPGPASPLSGAWALTNEVQSTSYRTFEGLQLGYRLRLEQDGAIVVGKGEKWSENGREIPLSRRTPISIAGTLHEGRLELSFTEMGTRRSSAGRFVWQMSDEGELRGTFSSDAAASRGSSYARRLQ